MTQAGRVLQVSVSRGGVPKLAVERARVTRLGLEGDAHRERTAHGGPHRAVCLFGIETIERLQAEGHPVEPGSVGENLTTSGVEWSLLPVGTRARIGERVVLEVSSSTTPCATQRPNFRDGKFSRISIALHPSDSRMYARVIEEGEVRAGDSIEIQPPPDGSRAREELLLGRLDRAETSSSTEIWRAAIEAGYDVGVVADGELAMAASAALPEPAFNRASGLARLPNLIDEARAFYDRHGTAGWLVTEEAPWPDSRAETTVEVFAAMPANVPTSPVVDGLQIRRLASDEQDLWTRVHESDGPDSGHHVGPAWAAITSRLAERPHVRLLLAEVEGEPVATAAVYTSRSVGWLRAAVVAPRARGRGIQRALIAARAEMAAAAGCELLGAWAEHGTASARNLARSGFEQIGRREFHHYVPTGDNP